MQKQIYTPAEEEELMAQLWAPQISNNLEAFVMFAYPWGEPGTPLEHFKGPRKWQRDVLRDMSRHIEKNQFGKAMQIAMDVFQDSTVSGRGVGKSALVAWLIHWMLTTRVGSTVIVSANTESQLRTITWGELGKWTALLINSHWWEISATKLMPATWLTTLVERDLKKGTRYWAAEGKLWSEENPDGYAGAHNMEGMLVIFDEASGIPDSIWSVAAGFFTENIPDRYWLAFSNGRRNDGYFFEIHEGGKGRFWNTRAIDARDVEHTDKTFYAKLIEEYGEDSDEARVEVYGQFPAFGDETFIPRFLAHDASRRPKWNDVTAPVVMGVDPAGGGADSTVIAVRKGRDLIHVERFRTPDTMEAVGRIIEAIEEFNPTLTVIDETGLGYVFRDRLVEQNYHVRGVNFAWKSKRPLTWGNKRAEIWGAMRDWLKDASIPDDKRLISDLISVRKKRNSRGIQFLESKEDMRARKCPSPDSADAIACTFAFPVGSGLAVAHSPARIAQGYSHFDVPAGADSWMGA